MRMQTVVTAVSGLVGMPSLSLLSIAVSVRVLAASVQETAYNGELQ
jgi:hypothetical protein